MLLYLYEANLTTPTMIYLGVNDPFECQYQLVAFRSTCIPISLHNTLIIHHMRPEIGIHRRGNKFNFCESSATDSYHIGPKESG